MVRLRHNASHHQKEKIANANFSFCVTDVTKVEPCRFWFPSGRPQPFCLAGRARKKGKTFPLTGESPARGTIIVNQVWYSKSVKLFLFFSGSSPAVTLFICPVWAFFFLKYFFRTLNNNWTWAKFEPFNDYKV